MREYQLCVPPLSEQKAIAVIAAVEPFVPLTLPPLPKLLFTSNTGIFALFLSWFF
ncbi:hypothetical protein [Nostoc sp. NMS7]|uniref:hypothetical protein n=1 Tax=Nostoc sp. NMS7 TaxID=2815391 RepID=UPI0025F06A02|nr:hypothetical protein [Nostoc sp. NMS7]